MQKPLTAQQVAAITKDGNYWIDRNLYLQVRGGGASRSYRLRYRLRGRECSMGLGSTRLFTLTDARRRAVDAMRLVADGKDPVALRRAERRAERVMTFAEATDAYVAAHKDSWSPKHAENWPGQVKRHTGAIARLAVNQIDSNRIVSVLQPIWATIPTTAGNMADEDGFIRDASGSIMKKPHNIRNALRLMGYHLRYDTFSDKVVAVDEDGTVVAAGDAFVNDTWIRMDDEFGFLPDKNTLWRSTLFETARRDPFHPVLDRLSAIDWDGKGRVGTWLVDYAHVEDTPFNRAVGTIVLKAAVQRLLTPGCKFDETLLLQGGQGLGKSTMIKIMALDEDWFTDSMPIQESEQRIIEATRGKWIVEIPEMQGRDRASVDATKAQLSRTHDRARLAYATVVEEVPRMFIMITTGNDGKMLVDLTGNRRFWPVRITQKVDLERLANDMEQLWAEAMVMLEWDPGIGLPEDLWADAVNLQEDMTIDNPFEDKLLSVLKDAKGVLASVDVWEILGINGPQQRGCSQMMGKAMEKLGWAPKVRTINGARNTRCYVRPADGSCDVTLQLSRSGLDSRIRGVEPIVRLEDLRDEGPED